MIKVVAMSGSLRKGSYNTALLRTAAELMPSGSTLEIVAIDDFPLYNGDLEAGGMPAAVSTVKEKFVQANGLLISTPEYNNSIPGVLKNAIDWISRPGSDIPKVFGEKPVAIIGATPGGFGTVHAQTAWLPIFRFFKMRPCYSNSLLISQAHTRFDEQGKLTDNDIRAALVKYLEDFVGFIKD
jgi:chromate reductase, NAD(P)H dehydrogenase (quinone)